MTWMAQATEARLLDAFGWSLLHLLWQGTLLALALRGFLAVARGCAAQVRYVASCAALGLVMLCPIGTFVYLAADAAAPLHANSLLVPAHTASPTNYQGWQDASSFLESAAAAADREMPWILAAWIIGVLVLLTKAISACIAADRLKTASLESVPETLLTLAKQTATRLRVRQAFQIFASKAVTAPTMIGWLKPVILFPVASLAGLAPSQLEAMLAHELAHIRRHDYLVNSLQIAIETLLFYHPAVWWISKQIRREREHCCDDAAVTVTGSPLIYAKALYLLEEQRSITPQLTLGGNGGQLTMRIRRLLTGRESVAGSRGTAFLFLAMGVLVICAMLMVSNSTRARASAQAPQSKSSSDANDIIPPVIGESEARQHLLQHPAPIYPPIARAAHVAGDVQITIVIDSSGNVIKANPISGPAMLMHAALDAVNKWQFTPFSINGTPAQMTTTLTIPVVLEDTGAAPVQNQQATQDNNPPDMSCGYYDEKIIMHPGTCEASKSVSGQYDCRDSDDRQRTQKQAACEWKVNRFQEWEQEHDKDKK